MKKIIISLLVCFFLVLGSLPLYAARGDRETLNYGYVESASATVDSALVAYPCYVYGVTLFASSANASVIIHDHASNNTGTAKIELGEATAWDSNRQVFDPPVALNNGAYADVTNCSVVLEYR